MSLFDDIMSAVGSDATGIISGIVTGTVKENYDKDNPGKIKVELFLGESGKNVTGWVSVMTPYAGNEFGYYSLPEVGSEVVVAFNMGDRNCPVVLGCLWNGKNQFPKETVDEKNEKKNFITKGQNKLFVTDTDKKQSIEIKTANGHSVLMNDEKKSITIKDSEEKEIVTIDGDKGEITIKADKKVILNVGGNDMAVFDGSANKITFDTGDLEIKAQNGIKAKGQTVNAEGTSLALKGQSSLQAESSGSVTIKGSITKIN